MILTTNINKFGKIEDSLPKLFKLKSSETPILSPRVRENYNKERYGFTRSFEYDFAEAYKIADTESMVAAAFKKKITLILKEGYVMKSKIPANVDYINKRLSEMEYVTGKKFSELLYEITSDIVFNHNCFILKHRGINSSTGLKRGSKQPIAAMYRLIMTQIEPIKNIYKDVIGYKYYVSDYDNYDLDKNDVYHISYCKRPGMSSGTPPLESVRDDILSLRQIEESLERLIYKMSSPIIHCKVGSDTKPAGRMPNGSSEIDYYNQLIANMEEHGGITTSHRVDVKLIGAESQALRLSEYLTNFRNRVLIGLNVSEVDLGVGNSTTGGAASLISQALKEDIEMYQKLISEFLTEKVFNELLLESKRYSGTDIIPDDEYVYLEFNKPNTDTQIKMESHLANLVRNNLLDVSEFERITGRKAPSYAAELFKLQLEKVQQVANNNDGSFTDKTAPTNQHNSEDKSKKISDSLYEVISEENTTLRLSKLYYTIKDELTDNLQEDNIQEIVDNLYNYINIWLDKDIAKDTLVENIKQHMLNLILKNI